MFLETLSLGNLNVQHFCYFVNWFFSIVCYLSSEWCLRFSGRQEFMKTENAHSTVCCALLLKISTAKRGTIVNTEMLLKGLSSSPFRPFQKHVGNGYLLIHMHLQINTLSDNHRSKLNQSRVISFFLSWTMPQEGGFVLFCTENPLSDLLTTLC